MIAPALAISGASLVLLGLAASQGTFLAAAALYGVGFGAAQPALLAMTADRVPPGERGRAMGTLYTAWELGISGGSIAAGALRDPARLRGDVVDRRGDRGDGRARGALPRAAGRAGEDGPSARGSAASAGVSARRRARRSPAAAPAGRGRPRRRRPARAGTRAASTSRGASPVARCGGARGRSGAARPGAARCDGGPRSRRGRVPPRRPRRRGRGRPVPAGRRRARRPPRRTAVSPAVSVVAGAAPGTSRRRSSWT